MSTDGPFRPQRGANQKVNASTTSAAITIGAGSKSIRVLNSGTVVGYFVTYKNSDGAVTCTNAQTPIGPAGAASSTLVIEKPQDHDTISYLADSSTTVLHFQPGEGGF